MSLGPGADPLQYSQLLSDELYEFFETVEQNDYEHMKEELGDLLLQIVLHTQMASEQKKFDFNDVVRDISDKLIRRHPHVFGSVEVSSTNEVISNWENIKKSEKGKEHRKYIVDDIPEALPALFRAEKESDLTGMTPVLHLRRLSKRSKNSEKHLLAVNTTMPLRN